mmetsp:Transcript_25444/g.73410  ORF Transcript_25444/g.73410 Transcript_25444/m.73410 type:complete len:237 (-) Transcript_25444:439-1149(-)
MVSRIYFAKVTASCSSPEIRRIVSSSRLRSASASASVRRCAARASSVSFFIKSSWPSLSFSRFRVLFNSPRSSAWAASCWRARSLASSAAASRSRSRARTLRLLCSMVSFAASSCVPSDSASLLTSATRLSTSSRMARSRSSSSRLRSRSAAACASRCLRSSTSRIHSLKIQVKVTLSPLLRATTCTGLRRMAPSSPTPSRKPPAPSAPSPDPSAPRLTPEPPSLPLACELNMSDS